MSEIISVCLFVDMGLINPVGRPLTANRKSSIKQMKNQNNESGARCVRALIMHAAAKTIFITLIHVSYLQSEYRAWLSNSAAVESVFIIVLCTYMTL